MMIMINKLYYKLKQLFYHLAFLVNKTVVHYLFCTAQKILLHKACDYLSRILLFQDINEPISY